MAEILCAEAPDTGARAGAARDLVRPLARRRAAAVPRRRSHAPPRRPRRRQRDRQARDGAAVRAGDRRGEDRGARAHIRRSHCGSRTAAASGVVTESAAIPRGRNGARHRRRGGTMAADDEPTRGDRRRPDARPRRRGCSRRPGVHAVPPDRRGGAGDLDGFLVTEAVRGDGALLVSDEGERFVDELAPRDEVTLAMQSLMSAGRQAFLDLRPVDMRAFPNIVETPGCGRHRSGAGPRAGRARGPLHDRRRGHRRARPLDVAWPVRGRRVRVHRHARSQPARVEFALGVLRLR